MRDPARCKSRASGDCAAARSRNFQIATAITSP